jgi:hypothetical protein
MLGARDIELAPLSFQMSERRGSARYSLWLPVIFQWDDDASYSHGGFTRNVSTAGVFVVSSQCPPLNAQVSMQVVVPAPRHRGTVKLECVGKVTRVEGTPECGGFAVSGSFDENKWTQLVNA